MYKYTYVHIQSYTIVNKLYKISCETAGGSSEVLNCLTSQVDGTWCCDLYKVTVKYVLYMLHMCPFYLFHLLCL